MCVCVCVSVSARSCLRACVHLRACVRMRTCSYDLACARVRGACVHATVCVCLCVCVCVKSHVCVSEKVVGNWGGGAVRVAWPGSWLVTLPRASRLVCKRKVVSHETQSVSGLQAGICVSGLSR